MTAQELKEYIHVESKIEYILETLGCNSIKFHPDKNHYTATQPDGDNLLGVIIKDNLYLNYYSYSRGINIDEGKDLIFLVQTIKNKNFVETMKYIHEILGLKYSFKKELKIKKEEKINPLAIFINAKFKNKHKEYRNIADCTFEALDEGTLLDFVPMVHIDIFKEGIMPWTTKKFGLGYSYKWSRTIFPHRYITGELMGWNGRSSIENCEEFGIKKYFITPGMRKICPYGMYENYSSIEEAGYCVIFESEKSVLKRDSLNDATGLAVSGKTLSEEEWRLIMGLKIKEVVIALDKDVNLNIVRHMCEKFYHHIKVSYIYDRWDLLDKKDSPADKSNKIYNFLFKHRIIYDEKEHMEYVKSLKKK